MSSKLYGVKYHSAIISSYAFMAVRDILLRDILAENHMNNVTMKRVTNFLENNNIPFEIIAEPNRSNGDFLISCNIANFVLTISKVGSNIVGRLSAFGRNMPDGFVSGIDYVLDQTKRFFDNSQKLAEFFDLLKSPRHSMFDFNISQSIMQDDKDPDVYRHLADITIHLDPDTITFTSSASIYFSDDCELKIPESKESFDSAAAAKSDICKRINNLNVESRSVFGELVKRIENIFDGESHG